MSSINGMTFRGRRRSLVDDASDWLAIVTDPACSAGEREAFVEWLRRSNLHVEEFLRVSTLTQHLSNRKLWADDSVESLLARARTTSADIVTVERAAEPRIESRPLSINDWSIRSWPIRRWAVAACILATFATLVFLALEHGVPGWRGTTYTTSVGEMRSIVLEDGSVVELNTRSSLRTRFTENLRAVELLSGEAIFKVARNPARPFRVAAGSAEIVALGTAFNVYAAQAQTVVTVLEGRVRVSDRTRGARGRTDAQARQRGMELAGGEQVVIAPHRPMARIAVADPQRVTSWTERRLVFEDTPLAAVAREFARYSTRVIRIENATLAAQRITGVFDATDPGSLVQFLATHGEVSIREEVDGWTLSGTPPLARTP